MEVFLGDVLWVGDLVFVVVGIVVGGFVFVEQCYVCGFGVGFQVGQFGGVIDLEVKVVNVWSIVMCGDGEVDVWIIQYLFGVIGFYVCWFGGKEFGVEGDVFVQVVNVEMDVKLFYGMFFQYLQLVVFVFRQVLFWQQLVVRKFSRVFMWLYVV